MTSTQAGWLKVIAAGAGAAQAPLLAAEHWTAKTVVIAVLAALVTMGMTAWALYQSSPTSAPPVTGLALLLGAALIAAGASGCGDDTAPFYKLATCDSGRQAWRAGAELICYEADSTPFGPRPWMNDTPESACAYCEGFLPPGGDE